MPLKQNHQPKKNNIHGLEVKMARSRNNMGNMNAFVSSVDNLNSNPTQNYSNRDSLVCNSQPSLLKILESYEETKWKDIKYNFLSIQYQKVKIAVLI